MVDSGSRMKRTSPWTVLRDVVGSVIVRREDTRVRAQGLTQLAGRESARNLVVGERMTYMYVPCAPRSVQSLVEQLPEAPWARVRKVQLIRREIREVLSPSALEVLWRHGEHVIEGGRSSAAGAGRQAHLSGSTRR
jgi:hypothetical protein